MAPLVTFCAFDPIVPLLSLVYSSEQWRVEGGGFGLFKPPPPPKFRRPSKIVPNSTRVWKLNLRRQRAQDVRKKGSRILKLPPVRNCFALAVTNKLVVITNNFKVPKIKILLYEMKFLVRNYSCHQNPWLGDYRPQIPVLCPNEFVEPSPTHPPPPQTRTPGNASGPEQ